MSMVVRTNTMAMSANSALNKNNSTVAGNLQKLSSGFRINRAADDASGLAVSEKMKAQIKALDQANKNAQDGASLIKTAEGYMGEIHDMLNRIVELAEKSANGTFETKTGEDYGNAATDRQAIQDEVDQLTTEIDRIATTANFNQLKLLDGSLQTSYEKAYTSEQLATDTFYVEDSTSSTGYTLATADNSAGKQLFVHQDQVTGVTGQKGDDVEGKYQLNDDGSYTLQGTGAEAQEGATYKGTTFTTAGTNLTEFAQGTTYYTYDDETKTYSEAETYDPAKKADYFTKGSDTAVTVTNTHVDAVEAKEEGYKAANIKPADAAGEETKIGTGLTLQIGETSSSSDKLEVSIDSFKTADLFKGLSVATDNASDAYKTASADGKMSGGLTINVSSQASASEAAEKVRDVINKVSAQRATLGAMENRLDYTMNNLDTASQNITDANSRIRDTDMAKTMMEYTQGNTLTQAAQAMLAQANQAPSQVLQLLQ